MKRSLFVNVFILFALAIGFGPSLSVYMTFSSPFYLVTATIQFIALIQQLHCMKYEAERKKFF